MTAPLQPAINIRDCWLFVSLCPTLAVDTYHSSLSPTLFASFSYNLDFFLVFSGL